MYADDLTFLFFRTIAQGTGLPTCFGVAAVVAILGLIVLCRFKKHRPGLILVVAGATIAAVGLLTISELQVEERVSDLIRVRQNVFDETARNAARFGLLLIPALVIAIHSARAKAISDRRRSLLSTYLRIANKAFYLGDYDRAIAEFSIAIRVEPTRLDLYIRRGQAQVQKGEYNLAIADFDRALTIDPNLASAYLNRGIVLAARGDHEDALGDFDRAIELSPTDAAPLLYRAMSVAKVGDPDRAGDDFRRVLKLTNHSDFTEPARFHLALLESESQERMAAIGD